MSGEQRGPKWEKRGSGQQRAAGRGSPDSEFVQLELDKAQLAQLKEYCVDPLDLDAELSSMLSTGTKITVKWDERNKCYVAFAFAQDDSDNAGYILTGRGGGVSRALRQLAFKDRVLLDGDWPNYHNIAGTPDGDDW